MLQLVPRLLDLASEPTALEAMRALFLASLVLFFGLDRLVRSSRERHRRQSGADRARLPVFALAVGAYALLNCAVGYLLIGQAQRGYGPVLLLFVATGCAFLVLDHALLEDQRENYLRSGRRVVAVAVPAGWIAGAAPPLRTARRCCCSACSAAASC